jgi:outer membrane protease
MVMVLMVVLCAGVHGMQAQVGPALRLNEGNDYTLSVRGGVMMQSGEARELVFDGSHKLSELVWDISGLALAGGSASLAIGNDLQLNAALWIGVTKGNGSMVDYDWFVEGMDWTHFSDGDVDINAAHVFDVNGTYTFYRSGSVQCFGILGYKQLFWDWSEYGRTYIYSENGWRDSRGSSGGVNGIDYEQTFDVPYAGLGMRVAFGKAWGSLYGIYSPFVQAEDKDHHILRDLYFVETFDNIDYIGFGGELVYNFSDSLFITVALDGHAIPEARGDMLIRNGSGETFFNPDSAGIENTAVSASVALGWLL